MTVRRLLSTRDSMYVKLRLILKYTRESTACLLNKRGPLRKREHLDQIRPACYTWSPRPGLQRPACYIWGLVRDSCYKWEPVRSTPRNGIVFKCNGTQRNGIVFTCNNGRKRLVIGTVNRSQRTTKVNDVQRQRSTTYNDTATMNNRTVSGRCCSVDVCMPGSYKQTTTSRGQIPRTQVGVFGR